MYFFIFTFLIHTHTHIIHSQETNDKTMYKNSLYLQIKTVFGKVVDTFNRIPKSRILLSTPLNIIK